MSSTSDVTSSPETNSASRLTGRVKWFNNKAGYGFITVTDGEKTSMDIFVHHTSINVSDQQYKYLVQGEYVEFNLINVEHSTHECQAVDVGGIKNGKLMCETRHEFKVARNNYRTIAKSTSPDETEQSEPVKLPRQTRVRSKVTASPSSESFQSQDLDEKSWSVVQKKQSNRPRGRPPRSNSTTNI